MDFLNILNQALQLASQLAAAWPVLAVVVLVIPAATNIVKFLANKLGFPLDGYSGIVVFVLNGAAFVVYFVAQGSGLDTAAWEPVVVALGTLLTAIAGWIGANAAQAKAVYPLLKKSGVPVIGFSYSK